MSVGPRRGLSEAFFSCLLAAGLASAAVLAGCATTSGEGPSATVPRATSGDPLPAASNPANPASTPPASPTTTSPPGPVDGGMRAPVVLTLTSSGQDAATGETSLLAVIEVNAPPAFPLTLSVSLPPGAQLTGGLPQETLASLQAGQIQRSFRVRGALTPQAPLKVALHGAAADKSSGLSAERAYPAPASAPVRTVGPQPPGGRPPGPVPR